MLPLDPHALCLFHTGDLGQCVGDLGARLVGVWDVKAPVSRVVMSGATGPSIHLG